MTESQQLKVLIVEDDREILELLMNHFRTNGVEAVGLESGRDVLVHVENFKPHIIVLDQMMPGKSGKEVVQEVRASARFGELPIMMVTGVLGEDQKVDALEYGADDYLTKPFSMRELVARVKALVRRAQTTHRSQQKNISIKDLSIDLAAHKVVLRGSDVQLTLTEFKILCELIRQTGQVLTRDRLREKALGNLNVTDRTIDVHMASLRKKLLDMGDSIETVRGVGYRLAM